MNVIEVVHFSFYSDQNLRDYFDRRVLLIRVDHRPIHVVSRYIATVHRSILHSVCRPTNGRHRCQSTMTPNLDATNRSMNGINLVMLRLISMTTLWSPNISESVQALMLTLTTEQHRPQSTSALDDDR
jgi:hypothetical protein